METRSGLVGLPFKIRWANVQLAKNFGWLRSDTETGPVHYNT